MQTTIVSLLALAATQLLTSLTDEKASFITTIGRDTVVVESVEQGGSRITGNIIVRVPATVRVRYDVQLRADGSVAHSTYESEPMGAKNMVGRRLTLDFDGDSVRATIDSAGQTRKVVRPAPKGVVPMLMTGFGASYGLYSAMGLYQLLLVCSFFLGVVLVCVVVWVLCGFFLLTLYWKLFGSSASCTLQPPSMPSDRMILRLAERSI